MHPPVIPAVHRPSLSREAPGGPTPLGRRSTGGQRHQREQERVPHVGPRASNFSDLLTMISHARRSSGDNFFMFRRAHRQ